MDRLPSWIQRKGLAVRTAVLPVLTAVALLGIAIPSAFASPSPPPDGEPTTTLPEPSTVAPTAAIPAETTISAETAATQESAAPTDTRVVPVPSVPSAAPSTTSPSPLAPTVAAPILAAANTPTLDVSITPSPTTVKSGERMTWTISWSCASDQTDCLDATLTVPIPVSSPTGIAPLPVSVTRDTGGYTPSATLTAIQATWTFVSPLPAGSSGQVMLILDSRNLVTPNGDVYQPVATFSASNATSVSTAPSDATVTVTSAPKVSIRKSRFPNDNAPEPYPGDEVTYLISASNLSYLAPLPAGTSGLQNAVLTDTLPSAATFVSAVYQQAYGGNASGSCTVSGQDPVSGTGGTVTCPAWTDPTSGNMTYEEVYITVRYPATQPANDTWTVVDGDEVTNTACVTASAYNDPTTSVTKCDDAVHGFRPVGTGSPGFAVNKTANSDLTTRPGETEFWSAGFQNTGSLSASFTVTDHWPCMLTSPTSDGCTTPGQLLTSVSSAYYLTTPVTLSYTLSDGTTGVFTFAGAGQKVFSAPAGTSITTTTFSGTLQPSQNFGVTFYATTPTTVPTALPAGVTYVTPTLPTTEGGDAYIENCFSDGSYTVGTTTYPISPVCAFKKILPVAPQFLIVKRAQNQAQPIGGQVTFEISVLNFGGTAPGAPTITDLLPANLDYVPGSLQISNGAPPTFPDTSAAIIETIPDFNGSGRTLVRVSWPQPGNTLDYVRASYMTVTFRAQVRPNTPIGTYTNTAQVSDTTTAFEACTYGAVTDVDDLNGNGDKTDTLCPYSANYVVIASAAMQAKKFVKGDLDPEFAGPPTVGWTSPASTAQFHVELTNTGNIELNNIVAYDILPYVGDTANGPGTGSRGSQWQTIFAGNVALPSGATVEYSASTNPCRGELFDADGARADGPAGCTDDWSASMPAAQVRALRFTYPGTLAAGEAVPITYDVKAPQGASGIVWNSVSMAARRVDGGAIPLPTEAPKVGLQIGSDLALTKSIIAPRAPLAGGTVTYQINVTNEGGAAGVDVTVGDQLPTGLSYVSSVADRGSYDPGTSTWTIGRVEIGETLKLTIVARISAGATGTITNAAQVMSNLTPDADSTPGNASQLPGEDDDDSVDFTLPTEVPSISIIKSTNTVDADVAPGPFIAVGGAVTWTYRVENTGSTALGDVVVTDDKDVAVTCPATSLAVGASMTCTATGTAVAGAYANIGSVVGTPLDETGEPLVGVDAVTDDNPSHYFGSQPSISIAKSVNGADADSTATAAVVQIGDTMSFTYLVTNTGNVPLTAVAVSDDQGVIVTCPLSELGAGQSMTCTGSAVADTAGPYTNVGSVAGTGPSTIATDGGIVTGQTVTDDNPANAFVADPRITLVKSVNGADANTPDQGPNVDFGSTMNFTYLVTNAGNVVITSIVVTDDQGVSVSCPRAVLAVGESMTCTGSSAALTAGPYRNIGTVKGCWAKLSSDGSETCGPLSATDPAHANVNAAPPTPTTTTPTTTPVTPTTTPTSPTTPTTSPSSGGGLLPSTGSNVWLVTMLAGLVVLVGAVMLRSTRLRRQVG